MAERLSITIVAYNNYDDIKNAVGSIERYTDSSVGKRIYIVDNSEQGAQTAEAENFRSFLSRFTDVQYINAGKNLGFGKGHNLVLDSLNSEYHAIVNPDILLTEDSFSALLAYMDANPEVGMCIPKLVDSNGEPLKAYRKELTVFDMFIRMFLKKFFKKRQNAHTLQDMDYSKPFKVPFGQGSFLVVRTKLFKELGGFDDGFFMYLEDADLCRRVNQVSSLMYCPDTTVIHKWEKGSHKNKTLFKHHLHSMHYYFKKWGYQFF